MSWLTGSVNDAARQAIETAPVVASGTSEVIEELGTVAAPPAGYGQFSAQKEEKDKTVEDYMDEFEKYETLKELQASAANGRDPRGYTSKGARALAALFKGSATYGSSTAQGRAEGIDNAQNDLFTILNPLNWVLDQQQNKDPTEAGGELSKGTYIVGKIYTTSDGLEWKYTGTREERLKDGLVVKRNTFDYTGNRADNKKIADLSRELNVGGAENQKKTGWGFK